MAKTYIGERYVPQHEGEWLSTRDYDRLSIVSVTVDDDVTSYISRVPVPAGTPVTDVNYWVVLYISRGAGGGATTVNWADILDKPTTFPPSSHTQDWNTITGKPTTFAPAAHNQAIGTINGLQTTLDDINNRIDGIGTGGGGGETTTAVIGLRQQVNVTSTAEAIIPASTYLRQAIPGSAQWNVNSSGVISLGGIGTDTYDIYLSATFFMTTFSASTSARRITIRTAASTVLFTYYVQHGVPSMIIPDTYIGTLNSSNNTNFYLYYAFQTGDSFGLTSPNINRDYYCIKAVKR